MAIRRELELLEKGKLNYQKRLHKKALDAFSEVIEINPSNIEALFYLANIFYIQGQINKSIKAFMRVLELDPEHTEASISLAVLYNDIGKYSDAKKIFDSANEKVKNNGKGGLIDPHINKKFAFKHFELAELYLTYNRYDEALFEYNKAIGLDPHNLEGRIKIAKVYAKKGYISKAFEELKKVKNEWPNYVAARIALGVLHYGNGNILEAQSEWQRVLAKDPHNPEAKMYLHLSSNASETNLTS